jgi:hypothetical protein
VYRTIRAVKLAVLTGKMAEASLEEWGED